MADCTYIFHGRAPIVGIPALKAYLFEGGLEEQFPARFSRTENFNRWSENAPLVKMGEKHDYASGTPVVVEALHATTADFTKFDRSRANIESNMGGGFYFTNTRADAAANYAGKGPDLKNKIERDAERIAADEDISMAKARKIAEKQYMDHKGFTMPVYVRFANPVVLGGKGETYFDYEENYDEETDSYDKPTGKLVDLVEALRSAAFDFNAPYLEDSIQKLWENFPDGGKASEIFESLSDMEAYSYDDDFATREVIRQALEEMGFDGVIDQTVNQKFGSERVRGQKMAGMKPGTIHFIAFKPNQVKSSLGNNGEYSRENDDIRYSKSETPDAAAFTEDQALTQLTENFGSGIGTLHQNGVLNFTQGKEGWPEGLKSMLTGREEAVYVNGKAFIDLSVVGPQRLQAVVLHELGEHFNLARMLGTKEYQALQNQIKYRAGIPGSQAEKVWQQVERLYPDLEVGSQEFISEVIAKLGEIAPNAPWYKRLLAKIKAFLVSKGLARLARTMTEDDLHELLITSLKSASSQKTTRTLEGVKYSRAPSQRSMLWNRWFGQSKMQRGGEPIKFYHGSDAEFTVFDKGKLGSSTTHTTATLGHFFSENPVESQKYGHNVREFYLSIQKPFITTSHHLDEAIGNKEPAKFAEKLKAQGYDGIYIKDAKYAVAFDSHQAKLTSNSSPSFSEDVRFSRPDVLTVLDEFTKDDDIFKHPVSDSKLIEDVMFEVAPAYDWVNVVKNGNETTSVFMSPAGKPINVTDNGEYVWINVASLEPGDSGGAVYAAVGNYAFNNGLKFIDDPDGVSPYAVRRRPVHMLSLALRFGTTKFMDVSQNFEDRSRQLGLEPLEWREGDDNWNTLRLFARNAVDVYQALPQLEGVKYDFEDKKFTDSLGGDLPATWSNTLAGSEVARRHSIGESTIRRAVFLQSLASTTVDEKSRILEQLGADGRLAGGVPVKGMFSRVEDFEQYRYNQDTPAWYAQVKNSLLKMGDVAKKQSLALLSSDHLIEIAKHQAPGLKAFGTITLTRGQKISDTRRHADRLVDAAANLNPVIRKQFNRIVNDSTDSDVNVAMPWAGITANEDGTYTVHSQTKFAEYYKGQANQIAKFEKGFATLPTQEEANAFLDTLFELEAKQRGNQNNPKITAENAARRAVHAKLYAQMQKLPPEATKLYQDMHDLFAKIAKEKLDEIVRRIEVGIADGRVREDMIAHMRATFENNSIQWYYAPLTRFGRYWYYGVMKDDNGKPVEFREHFETKEQLADRIAAFEKFGGKVKARGEMLENVTSLITSAAADSYTAKVQKIIGEHVIDDAAREALQDAVYQFHLSTLPDVSMRHAQQHRKDVKGAETDVMRSFASRTHHAASQLANMIYGEQLTNVLEDHKEMKKLWENPDYMLDAEAKLQAIDMLSEDWDTVAAAGYLEKLELHDDADHALLEQARKLRDHLHGRKREIFDADGKLMGTTGLDADSAIAELARIRPRQEAIIKGSKLVTEEYKQLIGHIIDELELTKNAMLNTQSTSIDQLAMKISNLNFFGMLGFGLSSMIVNTLQVPNVAIPMAMGKFSTAKTLKAFSNSFGLFMKAISAQAKDADGNCSITESLRTDKSPLAADRIRALELFKEEGTIDRTQTFDLVGVAEGGMDKAGALHAIAKKSGWMFHHGERLNREVTLDAAYTLAREGGMGHEAAINYARDLNNRANLNYSSDVAARLFRGPIARITLQFKKYQQGMLYNWVKTFNDMVSGVKRENYANEEIYQSALADKKEAKRAFMALLFVQMSFAGALGLPLMGSLMAVYGLLGDDDEDKDLRKDLLLGLTPILGADQAMLVTNGFFDAYTPIPLSTRMGQADLFFRAPPGEMDGKEASMAYALQFLGPTGGSLVNAGSALSLFNDGQWEKGFERLIPKAAADVLKSIRYATEGVTNNKGYHVKDMNAMESFIAATGFGNSDLNKIYMEQSYAKGEYNAIQATRNDIVTELGWQLNKGDTLDTDKMDEWNEKHPEWPINLANIESSAKRIQTNVEAREEHGYVLNPKESGLYDKYDFFGED